MKDEKDNSTVTLWSKSQRQQELHTLVARRKLACRPYMEPFIEPVKVKAILLHRRLGGQRDIECHMGYINSLYRKIHFVESVCWFETKQCIYGKTADWNCH